MFEKDIIHERGRALEDEYFQRVDQELLRRLREQTRRKEQLEQLVKATGIHDEELFEQLLDSGIDASNVAALTLTPLVFVAWADGAVSPAERQAVVSMALREGVSNDPLAFKLVEQWLQTRPRRELWRLWEQYAQDFYQALPPATAEKVANRLLSQATEVAKAGGGILEVGHVGANEKRVLAEIEAVLSARSVS